MTMPQVCDSVVDAKTPFPFQHAPDRFRPFAGCPAVRSRYRSAACRSGRREPVSPQTVGSVSGAPSQASSTQGGCQVNPGVALQTFSVATSSNHRQARDLRPLASARISVVLEVEIEAPRTASHSYRTPEAHCNDG